MRTWAKAAIDYHTLTGVAKTKTTVTLVTSAWSSNTATVVVAGVTTDNDVFITPIPEHLEIFGETKIIYSAQDTDSLTFTCDSILSTTITINVLILT